ncbi:hypothetical protein [Pelagibacterium sp.]|uniref:hypothetical protein n=1 Tax=Pelagibacterium sp. TaxID=1967288 RepID=UPI003A943A3E
MNITEQTSMESSWRVCLAVLLLIFAALPVQIFAVPGFEVTPALLLAPAAFLLFRPDEKAHWAVVAFMVLCGFLALIGSVGSDGRLRNLLGAASYSSGAPYLLVGITLARRFGDLASILRWIAPVSVVVATIFAIDLFITNGHLVPSMAYESTSYSSDETTFIQSFFPFYGKYAVITLATISMFIGALGLGSVEAIERKFLAHLVLASSSLLIAISFTMWSRQVMLGAIIFFLALLALAPRQKKAWLAFAIFIVVIGIWTIGPQESGLGATKFDRALTNIETGNVDDLSTGRLEIYRQSLERLTPNIVLKGCGFCNLIDVMEFEFSSLHNVLLTAVYKGGAIYAFLYLGSAFFGLALIWIERNSFARNVTIAAVLSIGAQSIVNDVIYFQVIPALMFVISGYTFAQMMNRRRQGRSAVNRVPTAGA